MERKDGTMKTRRMVTAAAVGAAAVAAGLAIGGIGRAWAHCQIPCGIYDDPMRFAMMREHVTTVEKAMKQIVELGKAPGPNANQLVRWVTNKDHHADELAGIVTYYFLQQRVKPVEGADKAAEAAYLNQLVLCHRMLVTAMKAKQTTDLANVEALRTLIDQFETAYTGKKPAAAAAPAAHAHDAEHGHGQ